MKYKIYHETQAQVWDTVLSAAFAAGIKVNPVENAEHIGYGKTYRTILPAENVRKYVHVQIYRMESGRYELNFYIG